MKKVSFDYRCGNQRGITVSTEQVIRDLPEFTDQFQNAYSENGFTSPFRIITGPAVLDRRDLVGIRIFTG